MEFLFILFGVVALIGVGASLNQGQPEQGTYIYIPPQVQQGNPFFGMILGVLLFAALIFAVVQAAG